MIAVLLGGLFLVLVGFVAFQFAPRPKPGSFGNNKVGGSVIMAFGVIMAISSLFVH